MRAARGVVLLVPGTGSTPDESFSWGYQRALAADGFADVHRRAAGDRLGQLHHGGKRVRGAIHATYGLAGRRIEVIGHSQGAALPVWAVKFWKGSAKRVRDVVGLAGPFNGTQFANNLCTGGECAPLASAAAPRSDHGRGSPQCAAAEARLGDLDLQPVRRDRLARGERQPAPGAANFLLQDICAHDPSEHGLILGRPARLRPGARRDHAPRTGRREPAPRVRPARRPSSPGRPDVVLRLLEAA